MRGILKIVKYIKDSALNSRLFSFTLCTEMGAKHTRSLFHTDIRWLSKGRVVTRVYELRDETHAFLTEKLSPLASSFSDLKWLLTLFYLADIFSVLNKLNLKLQGREDNIFRHCEQTQAFQKPLKLWQLWLKTSSYYMFPMKQTEENGVSKKSVADLKCLIQSHLDALMGNFSHYFPPGEDQCIKRQVVGEKSLWLWNSKFDYWTEFNSFWIIRNAATNLWRHVEKSQKKKKNRKTVFVLDWPLHRVSHSEQSKHFISTVLHNCRRNNETNWMRFNFKLNLMVLFITYNSSKVPWHLRIISENTRSNTVHCQQRTNKCLPHKGRQMSGSHMQQ